MAEIVTKQYLERVFEASRNWGRWGADDERGALNWVTPRKRAEAAALVRDGQAISCARDFPTEPSAENPHPALHLMIAAGDDCTGAAPGLESTMDFLGIAFHGMATSHLDALCHVFVGGRMYNGFDAAEVKSTGARRCDVMAAGDGIVTRGVLLDLPAARGVEWLELGDRATPADLEAAEARQGVRVSEGDCLLVSHGRDARRARHGPWSPQQGLAGLDATCIPWLHERRIAVLGSDGVSDALPGPGIPEWPIPVHQCCLVAMGVPLLDNLDVSRLAAACAERRRWEFLFVVAPLRVRGGTGSPVNPVAVL